MGAKAKRGDCYPVAANLVLYEKEYDGATLCHGVVSGQQALAGVRYGHAWVEADHGGVVCVIDKSNGLDVRVSREVYYKIGEIDPDEVARYNRDEIRQVITRFGHWGPWEK